ncbi:hypothetical protein CERSUDRAFT_110415 [Gelatoporia subvermispora B]|uniref:N-acetyltransferase domain-containing protein n=1 Tax=Ceriporiopsis subvermispora (strain B) TaxID=914234 RepID=M2RBN4_CERS8|nr:hypothetical protein CERSUDRAFT_110415 [Gelatoporia subvermispora B]
MTHRMLHPLLINAHTKEPYLQLPGRLHNIIITPPRMSDAAPLISVLNDPAVCNWLEAPPYPYLPEHADWWLTNEVKKADEMMRRLMDTETLELDGPLPVVDGCPVSHLREIQEDGTDTFLGAISFRRCCFQGEEPELRSRLQKENDERLVGDPQIIWCIGDYVASSHHGRGIMSAAVSTLLTEWGVPRMGIRRMRVETAAGNVGSVRVFQKNGFVLEKLVETERIKTNYSEETYGTNILWWEHKE